MAVPLAAQAVACGSARRRRRTIVGIDGQKGPPPTPRQRMDMTPKPAIKLPPLSWLIFSSRWMQLPLYLGLILAQGVCVILFIKELFHLDPGRDRAERATHHACGIGTDRRGDDLQSAGDGHRRRL